MKKEKDSFSEQIEQAEARFAQRKSARRTVQRVLENKDSDWSKVESPERVMRRMQSLNMNMLAGAVLKRGTGVGEETNEPINLLERILEENDLVSSRFLHLGSAVASSVGKLLIRRGTTTLGNGTGFLVAPGLLMTNHHVLDSATTASDSRVIFDFYERSSGATTPNVHFSLDPDTFFVTDKTLDYTIVAVQKLSDEGVDITTRGFIRLQPETGKVLVGEPVNIIQHPNAQPQQVAFKNNHIVDRIDDFLHYQTDTQPGSSGSPVFNMQWELAALHHSGVPARDERGRILMRDGSLWNGDRNDEDNIKWIANEGVRVSSIVRDVKRKLGNSPQLALFETALGKTSLLAVPTPSSPVQPAIIIEAAPLSAPLTGQRPRKSILNVHSFSDAELDALSPEDIAQLNAQVETQSIEHGVLEADMSKEVIVAEGDSWFDYSPAGLDILACLKQFHGYNIFKVAKAGDTLDNMAWGSEYNERTWKRKEPPILETLQAVRDHQPRIVLVSGGGNDIAGDELAALLNHKESGLPPFRQAYLDFLFDDYFPRAFGTIFRRIWETKSDVQIITHGYGRAMPHGLAVIRLLGFSFVGPWLRPSLTRKGYTELVERRQIINTLIDRLNDMLAQMAAKEPRLHYLDLRPHIQDDDWENELHLRNSGYRRVAAAYHKLISEL